MARPYIRDITHKLDGTIQVFSRPVRTVERDKAVIDTEGYVVVGKARDLGMERREGDEKEGRQ